MIRVTVFQRAIQYDVECVRPRRLDMVYADDPLKHAAGAAFVREEQDFFGHFHFGSVPVFVERSHQFRCRRIGDIQDDHSVFPGGEERGVAVQIDVQDPVAIRIRSQE